MKLWFSYGWRGFLFCIVAGMVVWWYNNVPLWCSLLSSAVVGFSVFLILDDFGWFSDGYRPTWKTWWRGK